MRVRYEHFGGIVVLDRPAATVHVNRAWMRRLGYADSPLWAGDERYLSAPVTAHFAVTQRCPLHCTFCYNDAGEDAFDELTTEAIIAALDVLARMRVFTVAFGGGEPLARPDIFDLARYARRIGLCPTLTTNGMLVDEACADACRVFDHIHVSLDGVSDTYRAVRGVDGFEAAARGLELLRRRKIPVGVNCVVTRANFAHLDELARFLRINGVSDLLLLRLQPSGRAAESYLDQRLTPQQRREFYPLLHRLSRRHHIRWSVDCGTLPFLYWHGPQRWHMRLTGGEGCRAGSEIVEIDANGRVHPCSFTEEALDAATDLASGWQNAVGFERFRQWADHAPEPCRSCRYLGLCHGGCRNVAQAVAGDFAAPDPECPFVSGE